METTTRQRDMDDAHEQRDDDPSGPHRSGPPSEDRVQRELESFAELIQDLARKDQLLRVIPLLIKRLGDLRRLLFDYEVRGTERLLPVEDPHEREARRIIREVEERKREMTAEWEQGWEPGEADADPEDDDGGIA